MSDLIRREDARVLPEELSKYKITISPGRGNGKEFMTAVLQALGKAQLKIDQAPAVDAVEVVRCKDCKHRGSPYNCPMRKLVMPFAGAGSYEDCTEDDGYCHKGVKKDGGAE